MKFGIAVGTGVPLKSATREEMWTPQRNSRVRNTVHALGGLGRSGTREVRDLQRESIRVSTELYLAPDRGIVIAVMAYLYDVALALGGIRDRILQELPHRPN